MKFLTRADALQIGDRVMPPTRELQLWMRRDLREKGLAESALHLTITEIDEGSPDKKGRWLIFRCDQTPEWLGECKPYKFTFKARPETPWAKVRVAEGLTP